MGWLIQHGDPAECYRSALEAYDDMVNAYFFALRDLSTGQIEDDAALADQGLAGYEAAQDRIRATSDAMQIASCN
jgi:hypothetical protein